MFGYRLALRLPLLAVQEAPPGRVLGCFALFAFFVELVPCLRSDGDHVRYLVGIVRTVVGGRYAMAALQRYPRKSVFARYCFACGMPAKGEAVSGESAPAA